MGRACASQDDMDPGVPPADAGEQSSAGRVGVFRLATDVGVLGQACAPMVAWNPACVCGPTTHATRHPRATTPATLLRTRVRSRSDQRQLLSPGLNRIVICETWDWRAEISSHCHVFQGYSGYYTGYWGYHTGY